MAGKPQTIHVPGLGGRLAALIRARGLTQLSLAKLSALSRQTVSQAFTQDRVTRPTAEALAQALDVTLEQLLNGEASAGGMSRPGVSAVRETPRHARNFPHAVRVWLKEFELDLTKAGADDEELRRAIALVTAPEVFTYFSRSGPREHSENDVIIGMEALAQVVRRELKKRGEKTR